MGGLKEGRTHPPEVGYALHSSAMPIPTVLQIMMDTMIQPHTAVTGIGKVGVRDRKTQQQSPQPAPRRTRPAPEPRGGETADHARRKAQNAEGHAKVC